LNEPGLEENERIVSFHPLLGKTVPTETSSGIRAWEGEINLNDHLYIHDHKITTIPDPVVPAAVYVEIILAMLLDLFPNTAPNAHNIAFTNVLTLSSNESHKVRTRLLPAEYPGEEKMFQITIVQDNGQEVILSEGCVNLNNSHRYGKQGMATQIVSRQVSC
jgi:hypothetical protein